MIEEAEQTGNLGALAYRHGELAALLWVLEAPLELRTESEGEEEGEDEDEEKGEEEKEEEGEEEDVVVGSFDSFSGHQSDSVLLHEGFDVSPTPVRRSLLIMIFYGFIVGLFLLGLGVLWGT
jgi:hypothetical protein